MSSQGSGPRSSDTRALVTQQRQQEKIKQWLNTDGDTSRVHSHFRKLGATWANHDLMLLGPYPEEGKLVL